jgi:hypothetical protein
MFGHNEKWVRIVDFRQLQCTVLTQEQDPGKLDWSKKYSSSLVDSLNIKHLTNDRIQIIYNVYI